MEGQAIHFNANLAHSVLHDEYLGDNDDDAKMPHTALAIQLLDFYMKTHIYMTDNFINCMA